MAFSFSSAMLSPSCKFRRAAARIRALQRAGHFVVDRDRLTAVVGLADKVPGIARRGMTGKAILAEAVVHFRKPALADAGPLLADLKFKEFPVAGGGTEARSPV